MEAAALPAPQNTAEAEGVKQVLNELLDMTNAALSQAFLAWHYKNPGNGLTPVCHSSLTLGHKEGKPVLRLLTFLGGEQPAPVPVPAPTPAGGEPAA